MPGTLFVVATPIGNLEDITHRAVRILREVTLIAAEDTRRTAQLLARYAIATPTSSLHEHNEARKVPMLIERLARGEDVAVVSDAGTPTISDPGWRLTRAAIDAGIRVEPIPGPSAIVAALTVAGFSSGTFTFLGFPPSRSGARSSWLERLRKLTGTVVFFEAPHRVRETLEAVRVTVGDIDVAVCRELTKTHEEVLRGSLNLVLDLMRDPRGEFTVVLNLVDSQNHVVDEGLREASVLSMFGDLTNNDQLSRRTAVTTVARRFGLRPNEVYELIEKSKKSTE